MVMNKKMQVKMIKRKIKILKVSPDLIDVEAYVDSTLNFNENWDNIRPKVMKLKKSIAKTLKGRTSSWEMTEKATNIDNKRGYKSKSTDDRIRAKKTFFADSINKKQYKKWTNKPNRYDIEGVDTQGGW